MYQGRLPRGLIQRDERAAVAVVGVGADDGAVQVGGVVVDAPGFFFVLGDEGLVFLVVFGRHGLECGGEQRVRAPPEDDVFGVLEVVEDAADFLAVIVGVVDHGRDARVVEDGPAPADDALPFRRQGVVRLCLSEDAVELWRAEGEELPFRRIAARIVFFILLFDVLVLHDDVVRVDNPRCLAEMLGNGLADDEVRHIDEVVGPLLEVLRVVLHIHGGHCIIIIVRIVDEYNIRMQFFEVDMAVVDDGDVFRILVDLIVPGSRRAVGVTVAVGNGDDHGLAMFAVFVRGHPDAFEAVPHGGLVREEHDELAAFFLLEVFLGELHEVAAEVAGLAERRPVRLRGQLCECLLHALDDAPVAFLLLRLHALDDVQHGGQHAPRFLELCPLHRQSGPIKFSLRHAEQFQHFLLRTDSHIPAPIVFIPG